MQYDEQNLWWQGTDQAFRLLALPLEMREAIYLQVIGPVVVPDMIVQPDMRKKLVLGKGHSFEDRSRVGRRVDPDIQRPNMTIMRICKQVNEEATTVANRDTIKRFTRLRAPIGGLCQNLFRSRRRHHLQTLSSALPWRRRGRGGSAGRPVGRAQVRAGRNRAGRRG